MRCKVCDKRLERGELSKKDKHGSFQDTCRSCMASVYDVTTEFELMQNVVGLKLVADDYFRNDENN